MQEVLATVNINIGLGTDNPSLVIREGDHVPSLVNRLISNYNLPKKVYAIIMERVAQELPQPPQPQPPSNALLNNTAKVEKPSAVSPVRPAKSLTPKHAGSRQPAAGKENSRNNGNLALNQSKHLQKKPLSPLNKTSLPAVKKIEIRPSKSPAKVATSQARPASKSLKPADSNSSMLKLFRYLTKCNPGDLQVLSPEHINLKGLDRELLSSLQDFFSCLEEEELEGMTAECFSARVQQLGFGRRLGRREYG